MLSMLTGMPATSHRMTEMAPISQDRRASAREPAVANQVRVEWFEGGQTRGTAGRVVNISRGGAFLVADRPPPRGKTLRLRMVEPTGTDEVGANVVRHGESDRVGLSFTDPCPYDLHLAATLGINPFPGLAVGR